MPTGEWRAARRPSGAHEEGGKTSSTTTGRFRRQPPPDAHSCGRQGRGQPPRGRGGTCQRRGAVTVVERGETRLGRRGGGCWCCWGLGHWQVGGAWAGQKGVRVEHQNFVGDTDIFLQGRADAWVRFLAISQFGWPRGRVDVFPARILKLWWLANKPRYDAHDSCFNRHCSPPVLQIVEAALAVNRTSISQYSTYFALGVGIDVSRARDEHESPRIVRARLSVGARSRSHCSGALGPPSDIVGIVSAVKSDLFDPNQPGRR